MEVIGLIQTSSVDSIMADSANTASALNTGHKSSVNALGIYADTSPDTLDDPRQETLAEILKRTRGMSIGIVTTAGWTDATPAAVFGHTRRRSDRDFLAAAPLDEGLMPEVIMGGDGRYMLPEAIAGGRRKDGRNMFDEYEAAGYTVVTTATELQEAMSAEAPKKLLGLFHCGDMNVWLDRNVFNDNLGGFTDQPVLVDMTLSALEILGQNENGFYLMVEAGSIDKQMHPLDQERALSDLIEMDNAVAAVIEWAAINAPDTLIVVTADHGHGYEVYGTVDVERSLRCIVLDVGLWSGRQQHHFRSDAAATHSRCADGDACRSSSGASSTPARGRRGRVNCSIASGCTTFTAIVRCS